MHIYIHIIAFYAQMHPHSGQKYAYLNRSFRQI